MALTTGVEFALRGRFGELQLDCTAALPATGVSTLR